ncbi:MAG TPA: type II secretion system F family protein [Gaiellales bacterium]|nr:type II secretion system F family protein [Gaiellales bacterium]
MGARRTTAALLVAAVCALVGAGSSAAAQQSIVVKSVDTNHFPTVTVTVQTPQPGPAPDFTVKENGQELPVTLDDPGAAAAIAVAIDTSNSMAGQKIADAKSAAARFVAKLQAGDVVAVYGFGAKPYVGTAFPASPVSAATAVTQLGTGGDPGTAIYGAVKLASDDLAKESAQKHVLIVLSDGASQSDTATLADATAAAKAAGATVYAVSIGGNATALSQLRQLTGPTGGETIAAADTSTLDAAYQEIADNLGSTFSFTYNSATQSGSKVNLQVSAPGMGPGTTSLTAPGTAGSSSSDGSGPIVKLPTSPAGRAVIAGVAALFVLLGCLVILSSKPGVSASKRIAPYTEQRRKQAEVLGFAPAKISVLHQLYIATEKIVGSFNYWKRMTFRLEQADLPLRTAEVMYIQMGASLFLGVVGKVALGLDGFFVLLPLGLGVAIPAFFVKFSARRRLNAFESQLPETLITMAASLKAGHAFNAALASVVKEGAEPTSKELARVSQEIALGMPSEAALEAMAQRMDSTNFGFVVMAVNIQRTVGGSLAEILDMVADTVRQRQQFSRKVKALTAQGRMSAYVLVAMPFLMGLAIFGLNAKYMSVLFTTSAGKVMICISLVMMAIGGAIIRKIVSFKG